jgi:hypothetical protein
MKKLFQSFPDEIPFTEVIQRSGVMTTAQKHEPEPLILFTKHRHRSGVMVPAKINEPEPVPEPTIDDMTEVMKVVKSRKLLTSVKRKQQVDLDHLLFKPSATTYLSGKNFKTVYRRQLQQHLLDAQDKGTPEALLSMAQVFGQALKHEDGIQLFSVSQKRKLTDVIQVLIEFFRTNSFILYSTCGLMGEAPALNVPSTTVPSVDSNQQPDTEFSFVHE